MFLLDWDSPHTTEFIIDVLPIKPKNIPDSTPLPARFSFYFLKLGICLKLSFKNDFYLKKRIKLIYIFVFQCKSIYISLLLHQKDQARRIWPT